jgi:hypothetical protein
LVVDVLPDRKTVVIDAHGKSATLALSVVAVRNEPRATPHITPAVETAAPALV